MYFSNFAILTCMLIGKNNPCFDVILLRIFSSSSFRHNTATAFQEPFSMNLRYRTKQGTIKDLLRLSAKQICRQLEVGKHALNLQARGRNRHFLSRLVPKFGRHRSLDCLERKVCKFLKTCVTFQLSMHTFIKNRNYFNLPTHQIDVVNFSITKNCMHR